LTEGISTQGEKLVSLSSKENIVSKTKVIAITSGKGGVGKSTLTANIAFLLSKKNLKIAVIDADIGLANMQVLFDVRPKFSLFDYIDGSATLEETLTKTKYNNITLCAGKSGFQYAKGSSSFVFSRIVTDIVKLNTYDILLVDTGAGLNEYVQEFLNVSDEILAVTTTDPSAITDAYALIKMVSQTKKKLLLCFNHTKNYQIGATITQSIKTLAQKNQLNRKFMVIYIGSISVTQNIQISARKRVLFSMKFKEDKAYNDLNDIVDNLLKELN